MIELETNGRREYGIRHLEANMFDRLVLLLLRVLAFLVVSLLSTTDTPLAL